MKNFKTAIVAVLFFLQLISAVQAETSPTSTLQPKDLFAKFQKAVVKINAFQQGVPVGENVFVIGHPRGFDYSLSTGIISGVRGNTSQLEIVGWTTEPSLGSYYFHAASLAHLTVAPEKYSD